MTQNKEGIPPVATLSIALYVLRRSMSDKQRRARGGNFVIGFININKYTSASENVHLCLKTHQLGHISVATGRTPSLFCANDYGSQVTAFLHKTEELSLQKICIYILRADIFSNIVIFNTYLCLMTEPITHRSRTTTIAAPAAATIIV